MRGDGGLKHIAFPSLDGDSVPLTITADVELLCREVVRNKGEA